MSFYNSILNAAKASIVLALPDPPAILRRFKCLKKSTPEPGSYDYEPHLAHLDPVERPQFPRLFSQFSNPSYILLSNTLFLAVKKCDSSASISSTDSNSYDWEERR